MDTILLLGDSLTQQGYFCHWVSRLTDAYMRRAQVVAAGLSGYNTRWMRTTLLDAKKRKYLIPSNINRPLFVTLLLGSNDCAEFLHGVPLEEYKRNMLDIIAYIRAEIKPQYGIFVMTPPPVDEVVWSNVSPENPRSFALLRTYYAATLDIIKEAQAMPDQSKQGCEVIFVDLHMAVLQHGDPSIVNKPFDDVVFDAHAPWTSLFYDGIHFNQEGGQLVYITLMNAIRHSPHAAKIIPDNIPLALPSWEECIALYAE